MAKTDKKKKGITLDTLVTQAREGVRTIENLVGIPPYEERKRKANDKIKEGMRFVGLATREELAALEARVAALESQLQSQKTEQAASTAESTPGETH